MKIFILSFIKVLIFSSVLLGQSMGNHQQFSFKEIPDYDSVYTSGKIAARMIDGLGFRFYWATDSLRNEDMNFRPSEDIRSIGETIEHIYGMTFSVMGILGLEDEGNEKLTDPADQRNQALLNLHLIREKLMTSTDSDFDNYKRPSKNGKINHFWNYINGPVEDCIWHCGQIASFRRLSGNPISSNISFFSGKIRN